MSVPLHETRLGRTLLERDVPKLVESLPEIVVELKRLNDTLQAYTPGGEDRGGTEE